MHFAPQESKTLYLSINAGIANTKAQCKATLAVRYLFIQKNFLSGKCGKVVRCEITLPYQTSSGKARIAVGVKIAPGLASGHMGWSSCIRVAKDTAGVYVLHAVDGCHYGAKEVLG